MKKESIKYLSTGEGRLFMAGVVLGVSWICAVFVFYLRQYVNITVVLTGTFFAVVSWLIFFRKVIDLAGDFSVLIPVFMIVMALVVFLVIRYKHRKEKP